MAAAGVELDEPACPLLGLALDPRTRYTFPHPEHRCHAGRSPAPIGPQHQAAFCLRHTFAACAIHRASVMAEAGTPGPETPGPETPGPETPGPARSGSGTPGRGP